jgi:hypothetical protein
VFAYVSCTYYHPLICCSPLPTDQNGKLISSINAERIASKGAVTNRRPRLAATTIIQQRSLNELARSPVRRQDRPDSSPVDPKENVSKQGKVSRHPRTVWPAPCIDPTHLPNPDSYPMCHQTLFYHLPHLTPPSYSPILAAEFSGLVPSPFPRHFQLHASFASICIHFLLNVTTPWSIPDLGGFCL